MIDRKFKIKATAIKSRKEYTENDAVLFLAKDAALPAALLAYLDECKRLGAEQPQIDAVELLIKRVRRFQSDNQAVVKVPDVDPMIERAALEE